MVLQVLPIDVFHYNIIHLVVVSIINDPHDVRITEVQVDMCLSLEACK